MKARFVVAATLALTSLASAQTPESPVPAAPLAPSPATPPAGPALTGAQKEQADAVKNANGDFFHAIATKDAAALDKILTDDAVLSGAGPMHVDTKASFQKLISMPGFPIQDAKVEQVDVRVQTDTVVAFGIVSIKALNGLVDVSYKASFMNIFAKRDKQWKLIVSYSAPIAA